MNQRERARLIKKCDTTFSRIIRHKNACDRCSSRAFLQCAHIISRNYHGTRWDEENAMCLCSKCHLWWHREPVLAGRWLEEMWPGKFDKLNLKRNQIQKLDLLEVYEILKHREYTLNKYQPVV